MTPPAASSSSPNFSNSPLAPDLVLRVGFAGKRQLDRAQTEIVRNRLLDVFSVIGWRLVEISPLDDATNERPVPAIAKFYSHKRPTLRLIRGLCEGADSIASGVLEDLIMPALEKDFAAVVPFPITDYRASRNPDFLPEFDQQLAACSYVVVPDGIYDKPEDAISPSSKQDSQNLPILTSYFSLGAFRFFQPPPPCLLPGNGPRSGENRESSAHFRRPSCHYRHHPPERENPHRRIHCPAGLTAFFHRRVRSQHVPSPALH